ALIRGICEIAAAIRLRKAIKGEWLLALSGVLSVLLAVAVVFLLALNPAISVLSVAWLIGFYALISGIALIVLGIRLRKATRWVHRLFVAIRPPEAVRVALVDTMEGLEGARWVEDDNLHLTLRFVGEVERPVAND